MTEPREIRDPVFGFVKLSGTESDLISTPIFQRLRRIRQLAFANLVYPGAIHTRFEHSLGVCHVAGLLSDSLKISEEDKRLVRLAALLHDLGHGPFSHISEQILEIYTDKESLPKHISKTEKIHELITSDIILKSQDLKRLIGQAKCEKIANLLKEGYGDPLLRSVVSGPLDADKQDYLLRDSYFCGVKYGIFDFKQLHRELRSVDDLSTGKQLMISEDGVHALEQFVLAKYYLTTQVYMHRIRLITDQMLIRAMTLGIETDKIEELEKLYKYSCDEDYIQNYIRWDDAKILVSFTRDKFKGKYCHKLLKRLQERQLLKLVFRKKINELPEEYRDPLSEISKPECRTERKSLEECLCKVVCRTIKDEHSRQIRIADEDANMFIVHAYTIKSVRTESRNDEASILVEDGSAHKPF